MINDGNGLISGSWITVSFAHYAIRLGLLVNPDFTLWHEIPLNRMPQTAPGWPGQQGRRLPSDLCDGKAGLGLVPDGHVKPYNQGDTELFRTGHGLLRGHSPTPGPIQAHERGQLSGFGKEVRQRGLVHR